MPKHNEITLEPLLVRAKQAAEICSISPRKWADLQAQGKLPPCHKLGRCKVWRLNDLKLWVDYNFPNREQFQNLKNKNL